MNSFESYKKTIFYILLILTILSLPLIIFLGNFYNITFDKSYYKTKFEKHNVYNNFPDKTHQDIDKINSDLLDYLKTGKNADKKGLISSDFFNQKEKAHLLDVKILIHKFFLTLRYSIIIFLVGLVLFLFLTEDILKTIGIIFLAGGVLTILLVLLGLVGTTYFNETFTEFHNIFFEDNTWLFNPETDNITELYPFAFFQDTFTKIILHSLARAAIFAIVGFKSYIFTLVFVINRLSSFFNLFIN